MLSAPLNLGQVEATQICEFLYQLFHRDFVACRTMLNRTIYIDPQSQRQDEGKENTFWHLITRDHERQVRVDGRYQTVKERLTDYRRAERIEWVKQIIANHTDPAVRIFYHQETNQKRNIRLYLWAYENDFVVILQKLGRSSSFLVTSFYVDHHSKRADYEQRFARYQAGTAQELHGCEWF
ncbi:hypothetical protein [Deefgea salmonis]|uniref:RlfB protein n=1 Tax=Deefgea salmonis TaxID=2875502 RepID=A0ABS8BJ06_9NEIS|nr:hypothetical protein [Deefgea salmonis]MCB5195705.1 hypothetical protein [Deefgea salmonis]